MIFLKKANRTWVYIIAGVIVFLYPFMAVIMDHLLDRMPYGLVKEDIMNICNSENESLAGKITDAGVLRQSFTVNTSDPISEIRIFSESDQDIKGDLSILLLEAESRRILYSWEKDLSETEGGSSIMLSLGKDGYDLSGKNCVLEIASKDRKNPLNGITFFECSDDIYPDGKLEIDGRERAGDLYFQIYEISGKVRYLHTKFCLRMYLSAALELLVYILYLKQSHSGRKSRE